MIRRPGLASGRQSKNSLGELTEEEKEENFKRAWGGDINDLFRSGGYETPLQGDRGDAASNYYADFDRSKTGAPISQAGTGQYYSSLKADGSPAEPVFVPVGEAVPSGAVPVTVSPAGVVTPTRPKGIAPEPGPRPRPGEASEPAVPPEEGAPTASTSRWVWVALGAGVLGLGGWYLLRARARAGKK